MTEFFNHILHEFDLPLNNPVLIFSLILFIILLSPILLKRLNIPGIIGLIISGVIIGPHGLNILAQNSAIDLFSTIGLLYIMFIAGLELDMNEFKANRNKSILFGFFTFILPISIGYPICYYFLGYNLDASLLTASMFATHTLVAYPIVSRLGISKNQAVAITVGGTILTDTAVLIILAVVIGNSQGNLNQDFWIRLGISLTIFSAIMFFVIPRIAKWFFRMLESEKHSHYIFVLSVVFFAAFLAEVAGVEPIIGAFVAGLALNKLIPHSSALMNRIEFLGNSLFIPFFLISVGMLVDIRVILDGTGALLVAGTLTAAALLGKWIAALLTQLSFGYSPAQRQLIFGLSSAHAAATLAVILVGFNAGILDEKILNGTIVLILITCIIATFSTEKAAKRIVLQSTEDADDLSKNKKLINEHILLPIANIESIEKLLELSVLIKDKKSSNPISILSVVSNNNEAERNILRARNKLENIVKEASSTETKADIIATIDYNTSSGITRISKEIMADIIILGWPRHTEFLNKLMGEKLDIILDNTDKTVFTCHIEQPLVLHKRIFIAAPPLAEYENGFELWLLKMAKLSQELSIPILLHCSQETERAVQRVLQKNKLSVALSSEIFYNWENFNELADKVRQDDLLVLVSARKGSASFTSLMDTLPAKMERYFPDTSRIAIYPQQYNNDYLSENYEDFVAEPLSKGIETIQKIGRGIGDIFKKHEEKDKK